MSPAASPNVVSFSEAKKEDKEFISRQFHADVDGTIFVLKSNGSIEGFARFSTRTLTLFFVSPNFRGNLPKHFFDYALTAFFTRNKHLPFVKLEATSSRLAVLKRWYRSIGGWQPSPESSVFYFFRPRKGESFVKARERLFRFPLRPVKKKSRTVRPKVVQKRK